MPEDAGNVNEQEFPHVRHVTWGDEWRDVGRAVGAFFKEGVDLLYFWRLGETVTVQKRDGTTEVRNRWKHELREFSGAALRVYREMNDLGPIALGIYALLIGGLPTLGAKGCTSVGLVDPYSIRDTRALESSVTPKQIGGDTYYRWSFRGLENGNIVDKIIYFVDEETAAKARNIRYGDDVGLPNPGIANWLQEFVEAQHATDRRYADAIVVNPSIYKGEVNENPILEYSNGLGRMTVVVKGKDGVRSINYTGEEDIITRAYEMLRNKKTHTDFNTNGDPALLISNLSGGYNGS